MKTSLLVLVLLSLAFAPNVFRLGHRRRGGGEPVAVLTSVTLVAIAFLLAGSSLTSSSDAAKADDHGMGSPMDDSCDVSAIGAEGDGGGPAHGASAGTTTADGIANRPDLVSPCRRKRIATEAKALDDLHRSYPEVWDAIAEHVMEESFLVRNLMPIPNVCP
jgi:hypothetical protein